MSSTWAILGSPASFAISANLMITSFRRPERDALALQAAKGFTYKPRERPGPPVRRTVLARSFPARMRLVRLSYCFIKLLGVFTASEGFGHG